MLKIFKMFKNNWGYTLIETVVTVAVVGIIVGPLASIFIGSVQTTTSTQRMLTATQEATKTIEHLKILDFETIKTFVGTDSYEIINSTSPSALTAGFDRPNEGYETKIILEENISVATKYALSADAFATIPFEYVITLNSSSDNSYSILNTATNIVTNVPANAFDQRRILLQHNYKDGTPDYYTRIRPYTGVGSLDTGNIFYKVVSSQNIKIVCKADPEDLRVGETGYIPTTFVVRNYRPNILNIYVFREDDNPIDPDFELALGKSNIHNNNKEAGTSTQKMYRIIVTVSYKGKVMNTITASKLYE